MQDFFHQQYQPNKTWRMDLDDYHIGGQETCQQAVKEARSLEAWLVSTGNLQKTRQKMPFGIWYVVMFGNKNTSQKTYKLWS